MSVEVPETSADFVTQNLIITLSSLPPKVAYEKLDNPGEYASNAVMAASGVYLVSLVRNIIKGAIDIAMLSVAGDNEKIDSSIYELTKSSMTDLLSNTALAFKMGYHVGLRTKEV